MVKKPSVLDFLESHRKKDTLPNKITIQRTVDSKYWLYLMLRAYKRLLNIPATVVTPKKEDLASYAAAYSEVSLLGGNTLVMFEGTPKGFSNTINPTGGDYVIADSEDGELTIPVNIRRYYKGLVRELRHILDLTSLGRDIYSEVEWGAAQTPDEIESLLWKARWADWGVADLTNQLEGGSWISLIPLMKKGRNKELLAALDYYGDRVFSEVIRQLTQVIEFKVLRQRGLEGYVIATMMGITKNRVELLGEAANVTDFRDLLILSERVVALDELRFRLGSVASFLLLASSGITVSKELQ